MIRSFIAALNTTHSGFIINGNYSTSPSGMYEAGGAKFFYQRIDDDEAGYKKEKMLNSKLDNNIREWITSTGNQSSQLTAIHKKCAFCIFMRVLEIFFYTCMRSLVGQIFGA